MCNRLGKKHRQYVGTEGLERTKKERMHRAPWRSLADSYRVCLLRTQEGLTDKLWNPQCNHREGISARIRPAKQKFHDKLDRYFSRT